MENRTVTTLKYWMGALDCGSDTEAHVIAGYDDLADALDHGYLDHVSSCEVDSYVVTPAGHVYLEQHEKGRNP